MGRFNEIPESTLQLMWGIAWQRVGDGQRPRAISQELETFAPPDVVEALVEEAVTQRVGANRRGGCVMMLFALMLAAVGVIVSGVAYVVSGGAGAIIAVGALATSAVIFLLGLMKMVTGSGIQGGSTIQVEAVQPPLPSNAALERAARRLAQRGLRRGAAVVVLLLLVGAVFFLRGPIEAKVKNALDGLRELRPESSQPEDAAPAPDAPAPDAPPPATKPPRKGPPRWKLAEPAPGLKGHWRYTDNAGTSHIVDSYSKVPPEYRPD